MKENATHIRIIRDENGKPVEAEYMQDTKPYSFEGLELVKSFNAWAKANRIPVTGDWPDREVFAMEEVEPQPQIFWHLQQKWADVSKYYEYGDNQKRRTALRLKAKQEPKQEAKTAEAYINAKGITQLTCYTDGGTTLYFKDMVELFEAYKQQYQQEIIEKLKAHIAPIVGLVEDYELGIEKAIEIIKNA